MVQGNFRKKKLEKDNLIKKRRIWSKNYVEKRFGPKKIWLNNVGIKKAVGLKNFLIQNNFSKKNWGKTFQKDSGSNFFL